MEFDFRSQFSILDIKRNLKLPTKPSKELAEFLGILYGDGYSDFLVEKNDYNLSIAGHSANDLDYHLKFLVKLFKDLFNINPKFTKRSGQQTIYTRFRSKGLYYFLLNLGFSSPKKNLTVPEWIKNNQEFSIAFIRGFADTDFSFNTRRVNGKEYPRITSTLKDKILAEELVKLLKKLDFSLYSKFDVKIIDKRGFETIANYIQINGLKNIERWMSTIGFHNQNHISRYKKWKMGWERFGLSTFRDKGFHPPSPRSSAV